VQAVIIMKTQDARMRGKPTTIGMADLRHIHYAIRLMLFKWQTDW